MTLFNVQTRNGEKIITLIADTEENNNDGYYPDRIELFDWEIPHERITPSMSLLDSFEEERGYRCGGIYFGHEEYDGIDDIYDALFEYSGVDSDTVLRYKGEDPFLLDDGDYYICDSEDIAYERRTRK